MFSLTVLVKGTFALVHGGEASALPDQDEPTDDFAPLKPRTDILVVGKPRPPGGSVRIGDFVKLDPRIGPVPPDEEPRRRLASDAAFAWATASHRGVFPGPVPEGFDFAFFQAAPPDQQIPLLRPGLPLVVEGLHPSLARVETRLPAAKPQAFRIDPKTGRVSEIALRCDTLTIDADRGCLSLVFRGLTDVPSPDPALVGTLVVASHPEGKRVRPVDVEKVLRKGGSLEDLAGSPEVHPLEVRHDVRGASRKALTGTVAVPAAPTPTNPLPFRAAPSAPSIDDDEPPTPQRPSVHTGLPFGSITLSAPAEAPPVRPVIPFGRLSAAPPLPVAPAEPPAAPAEPPAAPAEPPLPFAPMDAVRPDLVPPASAPQAALVEDEPAQEPTLWARLPMPLPRYASIAAEVAAPTADVAVVLGRHGLDEERWGLLEAETTAVLAEDAARGGGEILRAFDDAYVERMADLGRRLDMEGMARLHLATARRRLSKCLEELGLGRADLLPLRRSIARRIEREPAFAAELSAAIEIERAKDPPPLVGLFVPPKRKKAEAS